MSIEEDLVHKLHQLSPEKQREVLDFVDSLSTGKGTSLPLRSLHGLWSEFEIRIVDGDIASARHEIWRNFPREAI